AFVKLRVRAATLKVERVRTSMRAIVPASPASLWKATWTSVLPALRSVIPIPGIEKILWFPERMG
ncbi:MAG: hypothetical protein P4L11_01030, partial [Geothrix sp.]|nr:hypothetical protein [Geothrix sp.]